ncbi:MAG TPA: hypothetical protein DD727_08175 [Clostridiales bacterium]|nr:hypothetical protein [Clostridiales bacterium]
MRAKIPDAAIKRLRFLLFSGRRKSLYRAAKVTLQSRKAGVKKAAKKAAKKVGSRALKKVAKEVDKGGGGC